MAIVTGSLFSPRTAATTFGWTPVLLGVSLLLTGASGLIYQIVWFRLLGLSFGVTVHATSAVLAAFMAGLALGSLLAARLSRRMGRPLRVYGAAEIVIGGLGLVSLPLLDAITPLYQALGRLTPDDTTLVSGMRFVLAFLVLLLPTTLMGATLPIVVQGLGKLGDTMEKRVSVLYAANTAGAIIGAFAAGFILIGVWGLVVAVAVAATLNIVVGAMWVILGGLTPADLSASPKTPVVSRASASAETPLSRVATLVILAVYGLSGAVALAYEVVWTRLLSGIFPGTTYSFTLMLCAVLAGIAIGSWAIGPFLARRRDWVVAFAVVEAAMGITAVLSLLTIANGNRIETWVRGVVGAGNRTVVGEFWFMGGFALLVIFPTAFLMGMAFPIAAKISAMGHAADGEKVGRIYGVNTIGAIVGSLAGGLVLIPLFGAQHALWLLAVGHFLLGVVVLIIAPTRMAPKLAVATVTAAIMVGAVLATPDLYQTLSRTDPRGERTIWHNEGPDATIRVVRSPDGSIILYINSEGQATDHPSTLFYHYHLGHIGPLLHPDPKEVLVIGMGGGATPGATALHRSSAIDVVELYHGVVEAARLFSHVNYHVLDRPNVTVHVNDGRNFLLMTEKKYDIIEADIIQARNAGSANLYAADYYRLARSALKDGGMMVQWVDDQLPEYAYKMMVRTFLEVFPNATLWYNGSVLVGSKEPLKIDPEIIQAKFAEREVAESLASIGIRNANDLLREFVARPDEIRAYVGDGQLISDKHPSIEYMWTLPNTGTAADLRWRRAGMFVAARERAGDGAVFSHDGVRWLFHFYHKPMSAEYLTPPSPIAGREAEIERNLRAMVTDRDRVWFLPGWQSDADGFVERWLDANTYRTISRALGNIRVLLYASPRNEPSTQPVGVTFGDAVRLNRAGIDRTQVRTGEIVRVKLDWQTVDDLEENYKSTVRLVGPNGRFYATADRRLKDSPTTDWVDGYQWSDRAGLLIPPGTPSGVYSVQLVVYREANGAPLQPQGRPLVTVGQVAVIDANEPVSPYAVDADTLVNEIMGDAFRLSGYSLGTTAARPGDDVQLTLFWQARRDKAVSEARIALGDPRQPFATAPFTAGRPDVAAGSVTRNDLALRVRPTAPAGRHDVWLLYPDAAPFWIGRVAVVRPTLPTAPTPQLLVNGQFAVGARLEGATVTPTVEGLAVALVWTAASAIDANYTVFVHLIDSSGRIVAQSDSPPASGDAPTSGWSVGERVGDVHRLRVDGPIPAEARLIVGLYDPQTLRRVAVQGADAIGLPWQASPR